MPEIALSSFSATLQDNPAAELVSVENETVSLKVTNTDVYDLPGTGGIGTTVFYIAGGVLVAAALVLLVVKRKVK